MAWYDTLWRKRIQLTVQNTDIDSDLTDFPIYLDLSRLGASFWDNVNSDGGDIRVTTSDETTEVPVEIRIDTGAQTGFVYFKGSPSSSTTTVFYMYHQNPAATLPAEDATYGRENVWKTAFVGVWHLEEDPSGAAPQITDSTSNDNDGTTAGSMTTGDLIAAISNKGLEFDGSNDYVSVPDDTTLDITDDISISFWFKESGSSAGWTSLVSKRDNAEAVDANYGINFNPDGGTNLFGFFMYDSGYAAHRISWSANFSSATWYHICITATQNGANIDVEIFKDGASISSGTISSKSLSANNAPVYFAATDTTFTGDEPFNGVMDEIRIANEVHSDAWIKAQHSAEDDNASFITLAAAEDAPEVAKYTWEFAGRTRTWTANIYKTDFGGSTTTLCAGSEMRITWGDKTNTFDDRIRAAEIYFTVIDPSLTLYNDLVSGDEDDFRVEFVDSTGTYTIRMRIRLDELSTLFVDDLEQHVTSIYGYCGMAELQNVDAVTLTSSTIHNLFRLALVSNALPQDIEYYSTHYAENVASSGALLALMRLNRLDLIFAEAGRKVDTMYDQMRALLEGFGLFAMNGMDGRWHVKHEYGLGETVTDRGGQFFDYSLSSFTTLATLTGNLVTLVNRTIGRNTVKSPLKPVQAVQVTRGNSRDLFSVDMVKHGDYENGWTSGTAHEVWETTSGTYARSTNADTGTYSFKLDSGSGQIDQKLLRMAGGGQDIDIELALRYALESDSASTTKSGTSIVVLFYKNVTTLDTERGGGGTTWSDTVLNGTTLTAGIVANGDPLVWTTLVTTIYGPLPDFDGNIILSKQHSLTNFHTYFDTLEVRIKKADKATMEFRAVSGRYDINGNLVGKGGVVEQEVPFYNALLGTDVLGDGTRDEVIPMVQVLTTPAGSWVQASDFRTFTAGYTTDDYPDLFELTTEIRIAQQSETIEEIEGSYAGIAPHDYLLAYGSIFYIQVYTSIDLKTEVTDFVAVRKLIGANLLAVEPTTLWWSENTGATDSVYKATIADSAPWTAVLVGSVDTGRSADDIYVDEANGLIFTMESNASTHYITKRTTSWTGKTDIVTRTASTNFIYSIFIHRGTQKIFFIEKDSGSGYKIFRCDYDGSNVTQLANLSGGQHGKTIVVDQSAVYLYWHHVDNVPFQNYLKRLEIDTGTITDLDTSFLLSNSGDTEEAVIDETAGTVGKIWFSGVVSPSTNEGIYECDLAAPTTQTLISTTPVANHQAVTRDRVNGQIFYVQDSVEDNIYRVNDDGTNETLIINSTTHNTVLSMDLGVD